MCDTEDCICECPCCNPPVEYQPRIGPKTVAEANQEAMFQEVYGPLLKQQLKMTPFFTRFKVDE